MQSRHGKQWFISIILLGIGIILLLMNIGVISLEIKELFVLILPVLFILAGIRYLILTIVKKSTSSMLGALCWTSYGGLLLMNNLHILHYSYGDWWKLWPILIIYLGLGKLLFKRNVITVSYTTNSKTKKWKNIEGTVKKQFIGDKSFNTPNWPLESMKLSNTIGDYYFDFSQAFIPEGDSVIQIKCRIGDVKMLIPEDVPVSIYTHTKLGDIRLFDMKSSEFNGELSYESPKYKDEEKKITLFIEIGIGDIRIDRI